MRFTPESLVAPVPASGLRVPVVLLELVLLVPVLRVFATGAAAGAGAGDGAGWFLLDAFMALA